MKTKLLLIGLAIAFSINISAQIPDEYYTATKYLSGENLKTALHNIIKNHIEFPYTSSSTDVWDILKETDRDTLNTDNVILFYSGWSVNAEQEYNSAKGWSREHVWAKSHGDFGTKKGAGTDVHHLKPCDISVNSARSNKDFDFGGSIYIDGDGVTECKSDHDSWEPRDAVKGDVARMLFYMAVRYDDSELDLELADRVENYDLNEYGKGFHGKLSTLLEWHKTDPVDSFEINRNNIIYTYQQNRNPFIDHPEYANKIWSNATGIPLNEKGEIKIYPNPANSYVTIEIPNHEKTMGSLYSINGDKIFEFEVYNKMRLQIDNIKPGKYLIKMVAKDKVYKSSIIITE